MWTYKAVFNDGKLSDEGTIDFMYHVIEYYNQKRMVRKVVAVIRWS